MGPNEWIFPLRGQPWKSVMGVGRTQRLQGEGRAPEGVEDGEGCTWLWGDIWALGRYTNLDWGQHKPMGRERAGVWSGPLKAPRCSGQHCYRHTLIDILRLGPEEPEGGHLGTSQLSLIRTFY